MSNVIETSNLVFQNMITYPDITIQENSITFIRGKSGCGKSTLFRMLNGTVNPSQGDIFYKGQNIKDLCTIRLRRDILLIKQAAYLFPGSIRSNFEQFYSHREEKKLSDDNIREYLTLCEAEYSLDKECLELSGGEKQRVSLAIALSLSADVVLLDEPTSALDESTAIKVIHNITEFCKKAGSTLLVISHDKIITNRFAENLIELGGGAG